MSVELVPDPISWLPPPVDFYKLNVDAAGPSNGICGIETLIQDQTSVVFAAARGSTKAPPNPFLAKAIGMRYALYFALDMSFFDIQAESNYFRTWQFFHLICTTNISLIGTWHHGEVKSPPLIKK